MNTQMLTVQQIALSEARPEPVRIRTQSHRVLAGMKCRVELDGGWKIVNTPDGCVKSFWGCTWEEIEREL